MNIQEIQNRVFELNQAIDQFDVSNHFTEDDYAAYMDEVSEQVEVAGMMFNQSDILKALDYTAFRCGYLDYIDTIDLDSIPAYAELIEELEGLELVLDNEL